MSFDSRGFIRARFLPRTSAVPVPALAAWFAGAAVWTVRGLDGRELGRVNEAQEKRSHLSALVDAIASAGPELATELKKSLGLDASEMPRDVARRIALMEAGSASPLCDTELALKLCSAFPVVFYELTNEILRLTGEGAETGKPLPSGDAQTSSQPSGSVTPGGDSSTR